MLSATEISLAPSCFVITQEVSLEYSSNRSSNSTYLQSTEGAFDIEGLGEVDGDEEGARTNGTSKVAMSKVVNLPP